MIEIFSRARQKEAREMAELGARLEVLECVLEEVEWIRPPCRMDGELVCPFCFCTYCEGHSDGCLLEEALRRGAS